MGSPGGTPCRRNCLAWRVGWQAPFLPNGRGRGASAPASGPANCDQLAAITARCAITLIRLARYDDEPWISVRRPSADILTLSSAPGDQLAFSAASIAGTRITPFCDAPVAAAR